MKLTIGANGRMFSATSIPEYVEDNVTGNIHRVEINFEPSAIYSDLEMWLEDDEGNYLDHICMNVSKRNKLQAHK